MMTMQPKKVAVPNVWRVGSITMNSDAIQNATEQRKRILRSRALKWSRNGGSFLFLPTFRPVFAVGVGEAPLSDVFSLAELLDLRFVDMIAKQSLRPQSACRDKSGLPQCRGSMVLVRLPSRGRRLQRARDDTILTFLGAAKDESYCCDLNCQSSVGRS